jgi:NTP pyrophosphatase (non-canonical NTP hydrolase)
MTTFNNRLLYPSDFAWYQNEAGRTLPTETDIGPGSLSCLAMGIAGEAGEVADLLKKTVHHGHPQDAEKERKELGDVLWYIAAICSRRGWDLYDIAQENLTKLAARYPDGFSSERSLNRTVGT